MKKKTQISYTKEWIEQLDENGIREIAQELGITNVEDLSGDELKSRLIQSENVQKNEKTPAKGRGSSKSKNIKSNVDENLPSADTVIEVKESKFPYGEQLKRSFFLPIIMGELAHFWERGYVCHPAVLFELVKHSHGNYEPCSIVHFENIVLSEVYNVNFEVLLEFETEKDSQDTISWNWITAFKSVKRIVVNDSNARDLAIRYLNGTSKDFASEVEIKIEDFSSIYNVNQNSHLTIDSNSNSIPEETIIEFKKLDSYLGGFAVSSFIERRLFFNSGQVQVNLNFFGSLAGGALKLSKEFEEKNLKKTLFNFIRDLIKQEIELKDVSRISDATVLYSLKMFDCIRKREDELIMANAIHHNENKMGDSPDSVLNEVKSHIGKRQWTDAIEKLTKSPRDPFLLFSIIKGRFLNLGTPASGDRQSFLFTLEEFLKTGLISEDEMIVLGYFLGCYISYPLVWKPVIGDNHMFDIGDSEYLRMKFSDNTMLKIFEKIGHSLPLLNFQYYSTSSYQSNKRQVSSSVNFSKENPYLKLVQVDETLKIVDEDYELFEVWSKRPNARKSNLLWMLYGFDLNFRDKEEYYDLGEFYFNQNNLEKYIQDVKSNLLQNNFSSKKRQILRTLIQIDL